MKLSRVPRKFAAIVRRDWIDCLRHRAGFIVQAGTMAAQLTGFYFFARAVGPHYRPDGLDYYPFLLIGTAMFSFFLSGINGFVAGIKEAQMTGTFEVMMNTSTPAPLIVALGAFSIFSGRMIRMLAFIAAGAIPYASAFHPNWPALTLVTLLSVLAAVAMAMFAASVQVLAHRGDAVVWLFGILGWLLTGMAFPVSGLPAALRHCAALIPATYSIQGLRAALLLGGSWDPVLRPLALLALGAAALLPLSALLFAAVVRRARWDGSLSFY